MEVDVFGSGRARMVALRSTDLTGLDVESNYFNQSIKPLAKEYKRTPMTYKGSEPTTGQSAHN